MGELKASSKELKRKLLAETKEMSSSELKWVPSRDRLRNTFAQFLFTVVHPHLSLFEARNLTSQSLFSSIDVEMHDVDQKTQPEAFEYNRGSSAHFL